MALTEAQPDSKTPRLRSVDETLVAGILDLYRQGWFPMADPDRGVVEWVQPEVRGTISLSPGGLVVARSLKQRCRKARFVIRSDTAFELVIRACAEPRPGRDSTWINEEIVRAYMVLHRAGRAHSVEAWLDRDGESHLVGGLYGVHVGAAFFGESMFSRPELGGTDASKVCLVRLWQHLRARGFVLLDTQMWNPHLATLGCTEVPQAEFLKQLEHAVSREVAWEWSR